MLSLLLSMYILVNIDKFEKNSFYIPTMTPIYKYTVSNNKATVNYIDICSFSDPDELCGIPPIPPCDN